MKSNLFFVIGGAVMLSAVSCSIEENKIDPEGTETRVPMEFTAGLQTKTSIGENNAVLWSAGDAISVFDSQNNCFDIASEPGSASATFTGEAIPDYGTYYALYPYSADAALSGTKLSSVLPSEQYYADGTFATMLNPSVAIAADGSTSLSFHNVASILQVNVNVSEAGDRAVRNIQVSAAETMTGAYTVAMGGDTYSAVASGSDILGASLAAEDGGNMGTDFNGDGLISYYIVVLPGDYTDMTVTVNYSDGAVSESSFASVTMPASGGNILNVNAAEAEIPELTLYERFMAGEDIVIAGKSYNKSQFEDATPDDGKEDNIKLVTGTNSAIYGTSTALGDEMIIFVDIENQTKPLQIGNAGNIIVVGNDPDNKPLVTRSAAYLQKGSNSVGRLVLANLIVDLPNSSTTAAAFIANSAFDELSFDNCEILMNASNPLISIPSNSIAEINIMNSDINIPAGTTNRYIISSSTNEHTIAQLNLENNIFHTDDGLSTTFRIMHSGNQDTQSNIGNIVIQNNTFVNTCYNNSASVIALNITEATITKNILYINQSMADVTQAYHCMLRAYGSYPATANCVDNIAYYDRSLPNGLTKVTRYYFRIFQNNSYVPSSGSAEEFDLLDTDPFEGGDLATFTPATEYADYGAQR